MISRLIRKIQEMKAPICVGLDPTLSMIPKMLLEKYPNDLRGICQAVWEFNQGILDEVYDLIPAVKPQLAMYEQFGVEGMKLYQKTVDYAKEKGLIVIADGKRGDIGSTSAAYANAHIGKIEFRKQVFDAFGADMLTVNPYLGTDGVKPFVDVCNTYDKGIFVLVKTSNPSSGEFQDLLCDGKPLYEYVAKKVEEWGSLSMDGDFSNVGAVVGATYPEMAKTLRRWMPHTLFLVPGYGAQGASAKDLRPSFYSDGSGAIVNSSRGIIAAYQSVKYQDFKEEGFAKVARAAVIDMRDDIAQNAIG